MLCVIEQKSPICRSVNELIDAVRKGRRRLSEICENVGVKLAAAGTHPFSDWRKQTIVPSEHYRWVQQQCRFLAQRMMGFGLHVHVGMHSGETALYAMHEMKRWVYPLLAISANSPFYEEMDTGLASVRTHLFGSMPRTHVPPNFQNFKEVETHYQALRGAEDVTRYGDLWWSIRPQPPLGTVEIRVFDLPTETNRIGAIAAVVQASLAYYQQRYEAGWKASQFNRDFLEENRWKAMRFGLDGNLVEPETGEVISIRGQLERLFGLIEPTAASLGAEYWLNCAREIVKTDNEASMQRAFCQTNHGNLQSLEREIVRKTLES